ncbi:restriction endonuclease subunit S [Bacillaceae bacterium IKA-2]|nr:restriction endonuclease subunit S [Bacillaceae bacterium IKA-2]
MKRYESYKDSGVDWLGEIPEGWETARAKNHFVQSFEKGNNTLMLLSATQSDGVVPKENLEGVVQVKEDTDLSIFKSVHAGDFVISLRSFQGGFEMSEYEGVITPAYTVFRRKYQICHNFYKKLFKQEAFIEKINSLTVGIREGKNILFTDFANMILPIPPLSTQQAIANYLDLITVQIDTIIADKKMLIERLKEKRQIIISNAVTKGLNKNVPMKDSGVLWIGEIPVGWEVRKIKYLCHVKRGASPRPIDDPIYFDDNGKRYWVRISDVTNSKMHLTSAEQKLSDLGIKNSVKVNTGQLFISICASVGKPCIAGIDVCIHDGFVLMDKLPQSMIKYLYYIFESELPYKGLGKLGTQLNLNANTIANIYIPINDNVQKIVEMIDHKTAKIDNLIADVAEQIQKLNEYRKILVSEVVTGKVKIEDNTEGGLS